MEDKVRRVRDKVIEGFDLPKEVITDIPKITMIGKEEITIENHKGIISFNDSFIKVKTKIGILVVEGINIEILFIGGSTMTIGGTFRSLNYEEVL